jgi:hypothetical protein
MASAPVRESRNINGMRRCNTPMHRSFIAAALVGIAAAGCNRFADVPARGPVDSPSTIVVSRGASVGVDTLLVVGGTAIHATGYGSAITADPHDRTSFFLLTDRGPNFTAAAGSKAFPVPDYSPRILRARLEGDTLHITGEIPFRRGDGTPITGRPIGAGACGSTGETPQRLDGSTLPGDPQGLDSEGLVAMRDGTFWVSDEYGPFLVQLAADGKQMQRLSPCDGGLPRVYAKRRPNGGMEGLTITPDGKWLVGIMQAPLDNPTREGVRGYSRLTRILFRNITTGATREYAYLLDDATIEGNSEILALTDTRFLVLERDDHFLFGVPPSSLKRVYEIDVSGALDISAPGALGATPLPGGKTLEQATVVQLLAAGIVPVTKSLRIDLVASGFPHNKAEGLALGEGNTLLISNDDDFGISASNGAMVPKRLPPTNALDFVEIWKFKLK